MTHSFLRTVTTALCGITLASSAAAINPGFPYGSQKVRGVNLGGWLVLEPWITPSLFEQTGNNDIIDEWTFGQLQDRGTATNRLRQHWDTWITEQDFRDIAAAGLNHVRIPIGYWAFQVQGGEPYIQGQLPYLQRAVGWAAANNLKVIVDLHGAPGSQNGFDNSGQKKDFPGWHSDSNNVRRTNDVIKQIADLFKDNTNVVPIIAPLNEPAGFYGDDVLSVTRQLWQHSENRRSDQEHINVACNYANEVSTFDLWTIIGEWTPAATDCAKYLNGRGVGSRYDGSYPGSSRIGSCQGKTGSASSFSNDYKNFLRQYWEAQVITYEKGEGWIQWTWKAENADEWSYQAGLRNGWIPQNPSERRFPGICG
uniref:Putative glycoside hydrolase family 5 protein n=1 Tax=Moniliophthora roreri TaxID=221103 RepID=A0A0W0F8B9_MONRR